MLSIASGLIFACAAAGEVAAAEARPEYKSIRYDEDWSALRDPALRTDPLDAIKWIPLNGDGSWYMTLGGEFRERFESSRNRGFGLPTRGQDDYFLHRIYLFSDVHYGPHVRSFVEVATGAVSGWDGIVPATQEDDFDLLQGFGEITLPLTSGTVMLRAGRQEMSFGSSRLVSVRESPNIRRSFDAIRVSWRPSQDFKADAFVARPVIPQTGTFDDGNDPDQLFGGVYSTFSVSAVPGLKADLYYFGLERDVAAFAQRRGREERHTVGTRLFGTSGAFDYNLEAAYQFGSFGSSDISAWTTSADIGYTLDALPFSPRLGLKADAISGDGDLHDNRLGTFNPLFPKLPYFSEANLAAPANLLDIQPGISISPRKDLKFELSWNPLWKESKEGAFYGPSLTAVKGTAGGNSRFIGQQFIASGDWSVTERLSVSGTYVHFEPGARLKDVDASSGDYLALSTQWRF